LDDLIIVLERPARDHDYNQTFEVFVADSPVLRGVNEVIKFVTHGARSIFNTTVLDAFPFKPLDEAGGPPDSECHDMVQAVLKVIKPKTILTCCPNISGDHDLSRLKGADVVRSPFLSYQYVDGMLTAVVGCFQN